ncbi:protein Churchill-like [Hyalella azteca]|uniref:Protein Churchill n=1 Tax=Hyalella azteca TaxID=294128 RepID=A0A8B7PG97_HYAAZ|nr:protein Churchill-like [Hyalella azteca]
MCLSCVKTSSPDRGNTCLESGSYLLNLSGCHGCGRMDTLVTQDITETMTSDETQEITYNHVCSSCGHIVAQHHYLFWVVDGYQNYEMNCLLCGTAEDERSCLPDDPRKQVALF